MIETDWPLLRNQKESLLNIINHISKGEPIPNVYVADLDGLVSFIDFVQDAVVTDGIEKKSNVFGEMQ